MEQRRIRELLGSPAPCILEIGAHKGEDTLAFLDEFPEIRIFAFEPDPRCVIEFKEAVSDPRCTLVEAAASDRDGETVLHISTGWPYRVPKLLRVLGGKRFWSIVLSSFHRWRRPKQAWTGSSSIVESVSHSERYPWLTFDEGATIKTVRLDSWAREYRLESIDFIWADVQGAERRLIEGAAETLGITKYFFTECGATSCYPEALSREETIALLDRHGFRLVPEHCDADNLLFANTRLVPEPAAR